MASAGWVEAEDALIDPECAIAAQLEQAEDIVLSGRPPERGHPHHLVLALIDLKAEKRREDAVEEAEGMGEADVVELVDGVAAGNRNARRLVLADTVEGNHGRRIEGRDVIGRGRVRLMVRDPVEPRGVYADGLRDCALKAELSVAQPTRGGIDKITVAVGEPF